MGLPSTRPALTNSKMFTSHFVGRVYFGHRRTPATTRSAYSAAGCPQAHSLPSYHLPAVQPRCLCPWHLYSMLLCPHPTLPLIPTPFAAFRYSSKRAPRRLLTKPADPASNGGWDNSNHDLIVAVGDEFVSTLGSRQGIRSSASQPPTTPALFIFEARFD